MESRHAAIAEFHTNYFPARLSFAYAYERADRIEDAIEAYRGAIGPQPRMFFVWHICMIECGGMTQRFASLKLPSRSSRENAMALKNLETAKRINRVQKYVPQKSCRQKAHASQT